MQSVTLTGSGGSAPGLLSVSDLNWLIPARTPGTASSGAGTVDVVVNTGSSLSEMQIQPGLSVHVYKKTKKVGKKTVVTWWAQALDDGFGVPGVRFSAPGGRHANGDASGRAQLTGAGFKSGSAKAAAPGYVGATFRIP